MQGGGDFLGKCVARAVSSKEKNCKKKKKERNNKKEKEKEKRNKSYVT